MELSSGEQSRSGPDSMNHPRMSDRAYLCYVCHRGGWARSPGGPGGYGHPWCPPAPRCRMGRRVGWPVPTDRRGLGRACGAVCAQVRRIEGIAGASLYAVEVKVDEAVLEFKRLISGLADGGEGSGAGGGANLGIADFADVFDVVPPGVDELIALAKIVALAR